MKEILDKIEESGKKISNNANHGFGVFCIIICSMTTCNYVQNIEIQANKTNTYLKFILDQLQDTIKVTTYKPINK